MKEFTKEMYEAIRNANNSVRGTTDYQKYYMACDVKSNNSNRWKFITWTIPHTTGYIKTFKGRTYIMNKYMSGDERFEVTEAVKQLLGI